jgi:chromosome segregation ATPase
MRDLSIGIEFAQIVTSAPSELIGPGATVRNFMDRFSGSTKSYQSSIGSVDEFATKSFNEISDAIMNEQQYQNLTGSTLEKAKEQSNELLSKFQKESSKYTDNLYKALDSGDQERIARAQLGLIEQRMKYIVANANKAQDRLTAADVKNAEARTKIFGLFENPEQIKKNYEILGKEMNANFRKQVKTYGANGGTKEFVLTMYPNVPVIQDYKIKQAKGEVKAKTKQDYKTVLGTI